jgi:hypothetical protein
LQSHRRCGNAKRHKPGRNGYSDPAVQVLHQGIDGLSRLLAWATQISKPWCWVTQSAERVSALKARSGGATVRVRQPTKPDWQPWHVVRQTAVNRDGIRWLGNTTGGAEWSQLADDGSLASIGRQVRQRPGGNSRGCVPVAAISQTCLPLSPNRHAGIAAQRYPGEVNPHPPQSLSLPAGVSVAIQWAISPAIRVRGKHRLAEIEPIRARTITHSLVQCSSQTLQAVLQLLADIGRIGVHEQLHGPLHQEV